LGKYEGSKGAITVATRTTYHVVPDANSWKVEAEGENYTDLVDNKDRAVELAKEKAKAAELGQVIVHNQDGKIAQEFTYGKDPLNTPG
jgi:hypothetical protein